MEDAISPFCPHLSEAIELTLLLMSSI